MMSTFELDEQKRIFSTNLKKHLERADKSQTDLQRYIGVSSSTVSDWIHGVKMPRMDKIQSIANWLRVQKSDLLEEKNNDDLIESYMSDPDLRRLVLFAGGNIPPAERQHVVDAIIFTIQTMNNRDCR